MWYSLTESANQTWKHEVCETGTGMCSGTSETGKWIGSSSPGPGITNICLRKCTYAYFGAITYVVCKYMFFCKHKGHLRSTYAKK